jgi:hypothetical protein
MAFVAAFAFCVYLNRKLFFHTCHHRRRFIPLQSGGGFFCRLAKSGQKNPVRFFCGWLKKNMNQVLPPYISLE